MTDQELIQFSTSFREGVLEGRSSSMMCAAVCWPLVTLLNLHGVECSSEESMDVGIGNGAFCNHVWILLADGRVLDPTADQFNGIIGDGHPEVYLGEPLEFHLA